MTTSTLRFTDSAAALRERLAGIRGEWLELNENHHQFRSEAGGILNWFPSTGTLSFQGKDTGRLQLEDDVRAALHAHGGAGSRPLESPREAPAPSETFVRGSVPGPNMGSFGPSGHSELVLGLIGAVGTDLGKIRDILRDRLRVCGYQVVVIQISKEVIPAICELHEIESASEGVRLDTLMTAGNDARKLSSTSLPCSWLSRPRCAPPISPGRWAPSLRSTSRSLRPGPTTVPSMAVASTGHS